MMRALGCCLLLGVASSEEVALLPNGTWIGRYAVSFYAEGALGTVDFFEGDKLSEVSMHYAHSIAHPELVADIERLIGSEVAAERAERQRRFARITKERRAVSAAVAQALERGDDGAARALVRGALRNQGATHTVAVVYESMEQLHGISGQAGSHAALVGAGLPHFESSSSAPPSDVAATAAVALGPPPRAPPGTPADDTHTPFAHVEGYMTPWQATSLAAVITRLHAERPIRRMCEVGFNLGHSAATFLTALLPESASSSASTAPAEAPAEEPRAREEGGSSFVAFDLGRTKGTGRGAAIIERLFPGRLELVVGDSSRTLPAYSVVGEGCDLIYIDAGHSYDDALADLRNGRRLGCAARGRGGGRVLLDDGEGAPVLAAWRSAIAQGWLRELERITIEIDAIIGRDGTQQLNILGEYICAGTGGVESAGDLREL